MANKHWYAKKNGLPEVDDGMKRRVDCPCCNGVGRIVDPKTHRDRACVACGGVGVVMAFR